MSIKDASDLGDDFWFRLNEVCVDLKIKPYHLLAVMMFESGVSPKARNPFSSATGLIQFMAQKGRDGKWYHFGMTRDQFSALTAADQMIYVHCHFKAYLGRLNSISQVYQAVFLPASLSYASQPDNVVCGIRPGDKYGWAYKANSIFDTKRKGFITCYDLEAAALRACQGPRWEAIEKKLSPNP